MEFIIFIISGPNNPTQIHRNVYYILTCFVFMQSDAVIPNNLPISLEWMFWVKQLLHSMHQSGLIYYLKSPCLLHDSSRSNHPEFLSLPIHARVIISGFTNNQEVDTADILLIILNNTLVLVQFLPDFWGLSELIRGLARTSEIKPKKSI